jgi:MFS family permease
MGIFFISFGIFLPILCKEFGWSRGAVSGAFAVAMVIAGILGPFAGIFIAKYGPRRSIIIGNILFALGFLVLAFQKELWHLYAGFGVIAGLGYSFGGFLPAVTIANNWFLRKRSMAMSMVYSAGGIGGLVLAPAVMAIIGSVGWRSAYLILSAIVVVFMVVIPGIFIRNKPEDLGQVPDGAVALETAKARSSAPLRKVHTTPVDFTLGEAVRTRALWLVIFTSVVFMFTMNMIATHQIAFLETIGVVGMVAATAMGIFSGIQVVGAVAFGVSGLRYNMWPLTVICTVVATIGMALALVTKSLSMVFVYNIVLGIGIGGFFTGNLGIPSSYFGRTNYPKIVGIAIPFATILGSAGPLVAGAMYDKTGSYTLPFTITVILLVMSVVCMILAPPPKHPSLRS